MDHVPPATSGSTFPWKTRLLAVSPVIVACFPRSVRDGPNVRVAPVPFWDNVLPLRPPNTTLPEPPIVWVLAALTFP